MLLLDKNFVSGQFQTKSLKSQQLTPHPTLSTIASPLSPQPAIDHHHQQLQPELFSISTPETSRSKSNTQRHATPRHTTTTSASFPTRNKTLILMFVGTMPMQRSVLNLALLLPCHRKTKATGDNRGRIVWRLTPKPPVLCHRCHNETTISDPYRRKSQCHSTTSYRGSPSLCSSGSQFLQNSYLRNEIPNPQPRSSTLFTMTFYPR